MNFKGVVGGLGHRNWIAVVDGAFPDLVAGGVTTYVVEEDLVEVVGQVVSAASEAPHVRLVAWTDSELDHIDKLDAPGIEAFRTRRSEVLAGLPHQEALHADLILRLSEAAKVYRVVVVKTPLALPYTSVFFELECGYWTAAAEDRLRAKLAPT